jgi:Na+/proline symporter
MKNKGLVITGIVLIIISLIFGAYFAPIYTQTGEFGISGIDPDQVVPLIINLALCLLRKLSFRVSCSHIDKFC